jgi:hypothetical protein
MPYIRKDDRERLDSTIDSLIVAINSNGEPAVGDGDVNYAITRIIDYFYNKPSYAIMARGIMTLECAKQEFYRKVIAPYEDEKAKKNGEVYGI